MRFIVENNRAGEPSWWLVGDDNRVLACAGLAYPSQATADMAAHDFRTGGTGIEFQVIEGPDGTWRWTASNGAGAVATSCDAFTSQAAALAAVDEVRAALPLAIGP